MIWSYGIGEGGGLKVFFFNNLEMNFNFFFEGVDCKSLKIKKKNYI